MSGTLVANGPDVASPTFTADHKWTHLEARYNYEAIHTASLWLVSLQLWAKLSPLQPLR
jgi:hypothetical protein